MQKKRIFIAGGAGLLGTNLTQYLIDNNINVKSSYHSRLPKKLLIKYYNNYDFTNYNECLKATENIDYLVIAAVQASGLKGMRESPTSSILPNLSIHAGLLEAAVQNNIEKVIWISSSTVYQEANYPIKEDELDLNQPPFELYQGVGWVYRYIEQLCKCYRKKHGLDVNVIRTSNIYGPYDHFDNLKSHVIPALIKRSINKEDPFIVWGNRNIVRDFIFVDDLVKKIILILEEYSSDEPINVSFGSPVTINDLVNTILKLTDHLIRPNYNNNNDLSAVPYRVLDNNKFDTIFGKIKNTPLTNGLKKTIEWYSSNQSRD